MTTSEFGFYVLLLIGVVFVAGALIGTIIFLAKMALILAVIGVVVYIYQQYIKD